jgi:DNA-3-methyladenine glycosylase II
MAELHELAEAAAKKLKKIPQFKPWVKRLGLCKLTPEPDLFRVLTSSVISQLISTAAARTIKGRFEALLPKGVTPKAVAKLTEEQLRGCGLSGAKARAIQGIAAHYLEVPDFSEQVHQASDDDARKLLLPLRGIGPWTVDMLLMFGMGRPDVLPVGDLGLRAAVKDVFELEELPNAKALLELAKPWQPYRTFATWYLWRSRGWVPQSDTE